MWKFVTRGIRETFVRRGNACRTTNVYSQTSPTDSVCTKNEIKRERCLAPNVVASHNRGCYGSTKSGGGPKDEKRDSKWDARRSWSEAVGWSSVLAVGWVVCQSLCLRGRIFDSSKRNKEKPQDRLWNYRRASRFFINTVHVQPNWILPVTNCVANRGTNVANYNNDNDEDGRQELISPESYGPLTVEEALKEAKDDYTKTHRIVMGEFELRFGVTAYEDKRYEDAVRHFSTGADLASVGSMYNLGICHEYGIGTVIDTIKAVKYYRSAADRGHPDAMYNLGVFHAQGKGGLSLNVRKARELFMEAAKLGQTEARMALDMEKKNGKYSKLEDSLAGETMLADVASHRQFDKPDEIDEEIKFDTTPLSSSILKNGGFNESEESRNDEISMKNIATRSVEPFENSTDLFLRSLGVETTASQPVLMTVAQRDLSYYT